MRTYYGIKAIVKDNVIVDFTNKPEIFEQVGEMQGGLKVYADETGKQYLRQKIYGKFVFVPM